MKIFNTLTKKIEELKPQDKKNIKMYVCGITPYDYTHIGHARSYVFFDSLRRFLKYKGYNVKYVQNFTDIDDKIINKSKEEEISWEEVSDKYIESYWSDIRKLGVTDPDFSPRVSRHIEEVVEAVMILLEKGYAYRISDGIYFDVKKFKDYGKLSGKKLEDLIEGARVEVNEEKRSPFDFALWKFSKEGEPYWKTEIGKGRPGWHIECSVMSRKYLGDTLDIHGGGQDLIFPHHENEIAQSEALTGKPFSLFWIHNGFLTVNKEKMSKSLKNFFLLKDLYKQGFSPQGIRFFLLKEHWMRPLDFTIEKLKEAEKKIREINYLLEEVEKIIEGVKSKGQSVKEVLDLNEKFFDALEDDFNTPKAFAQFFNLISFIQKNLYKDKDAVLAANSVLRKMDEILGILSLKRNKKVKLPIPEDEINKLVNERKQARKNKDFKKADEIRNFLKEKGIILEDTPQGTRWRII